MIQGAEGVTIQVGGSRAERAVRNIGGGQRPVGGTGGGQAWGVVRVHPNPDDIGGEGDDRVTIQMGGIRAERASR